MDIRATDKVKDITRKVIAGATTVKDKAMKIHEFVRNLPYDTFGTVPDNIDELFDPGKELTCYGKTIAQASMLDAAKVPWRIELSKCDASALQKTIEAISSENPLVLALYRNFPGLFDGKEAVHTAIEAKIGGKWKRLDTTISPAICERIKDPEQREKCLSTDNVWAMHACKPFDHASTVPEALITSWNAVAKAGSWINKKLNKRRAENGTKMQG